MRSLIYQNTLCFILLDQRVGTREMANLNYGVCVRKAAGYCAVRWSATDTNSFSVSGNTYRNYPWYNSAYDSDW